MTYILLYFAATVTACVALDLGHIENCRVTEFGTGYIEFTWDFVEGTPDYPLHKYSLTTDSDLTSEFKCTSPTCSKTIEDLDACIEHTFELTPIFYDPSGNDIDGAICTTNGYTTDEIPGPVSNIRVTADTDAATSLKWNQPSVNSKCVDSYDVCFRLDKTTDTVCEEMASTSKKRKWNETYQQYGFTKFSRDGLDAAQCIHCSTVLANCSLKPAKLSHHQSNLHPNIELTEEDLEAKRKRFDKQGTLPTYGFQPESKPMVQASFEVALKIAERKKAHTIGEELIKPCAEIMVRNVLGDKAKREISKISLSNNTVRRRIDDMAADVCNQVCQEIRASAFRASLQLDESTDIANQSQLIAFVRYEKEKKVKEEFLFCELLTTTTTAEEVKKLVDYFFEKNGLSWMQFQHICTDGAPAMIGVRTGFVTRVKSKWPHISNSHCSLHRYALASKTMPPELMSVLDSVISSINFIRGRAKNHRLFDLMAQEMGSTHTSLLYHTQVRWLSRGKCLARVFEMHTEVEIFLREMETRGDHRHENYKNPEFLMKLAYLADIFGTLNEVNVTLQSREASVSDVKDKLAGLGARIALWIRRLHRGNVAAFPLLDAFLLDRRKASSNGKQQQQQLDLPDDLKESIAAHLERLTSEFKAYFDGVEPAYYPWYKDPFGAVVDDEMEEAEELLMLRESAVAKAEFRKLSLSEFWLQQQDTYPRLCNKAAQMFLPFPTTYLCEAGFSVMFDLKPKKRNRLEMSSDMRLACSETKPNILKLVADCKEQVSH